MVLWQAYANAVKRDQSIFAKLILNQSLPQPLFWPGITLSAFVLCALSIFANNAIAMTFEKEERCISPAKPRCQVVVLGVGQIDKQTPEQFKAIAKDLPQGSWLALSSPGGSVVGAMRLGQLVRELGFNTTINSTDYSPPNCFSACAYAFAGGLTRHLPEGSKYGIHQFRGIDKTLNEDESQKISTTLATYLDVMGVDRRLLDYAQVTSSDKMSILSLTQAKILKVDNTGQSPYPRWRLEATANGQLIALNNPTNVSGKPPVTLALLTLAKASNSAEKKVADKKSIFLIFYKSENAELFTQKMDQQLIINQKTFTLKQAEDWQAKTNGYQAGFMISDEVLTALAQAPEDATVNLNSSIRNVRFGVGGFKNIYQALVGDEGKISNK
jgi:hypothetical protein